ncbi:MAG: ribosomal RNA small subunit methyltransferase A [Alphaproteobacteria bacterium]|nr:MAG: ribosomal RNA small subunit methyltransferase A [Alphaproteobacteria bacterium]
MSGVRPDKRLGQHFLHERGVIERIVAAIGVVPGERIVEIGPGTGVLTKAMLEAGAEVTAIEIDERCWDGLDAMSRAFDNRLRVVKGDALQVLGRSVEVEGIKVVGNLPYNVGTEIVVQLVELRSPLEMVFMLQKEVIERICAVPDTSEWGRLGVLCDLLCQREDLFDVSPGAFTPPPKVMSSVCRLTPLPALRYDVDLAKLDKVLRLIFGQRRKMLRGVLKGVVSAETLEELEIDPTWRGEVLDTQQICRIAERA